MSDIYNDNQEMNMLEPQVEEQFEEDFPPTMKLDEVLDGPTMMLDEDLEEFPPTIKLDETLDGPTMMLDEEPVMPQMAYANYQNQVPNQNVNYMPQQPVYNNYQPVMNPPKKSFFKTPAGIATMVLVGVVVVAAIVVVAVLALR